MQNIGNLILLHLSWSVDELQDNLVSSNHWGNFKASKGSHRMLGLLVGLPVAFKIENTALVDTNSVSVRMKGGRNASTHTFTRLLR